MMPIQFGADVLAASPGLLGNVRRVALVTNDAARTADAAAQRTRVALLAAGIPIVRLFSPEHGLDASAGDGAPVADGVDPLTGLPVISLYGERMAPQPESLHDLDAVLFDVPDVGARFYTYTWTLTHLIDSCADAGVRLIVLDRPNPVGGELDSVEGPLLQLEHASFHGYHTLPIRHGLTLGEVALLWQREGRPDADVRVIPCEGWQRTQLWPETGLPFVPTSPAIRSFDAALRYPGLCLFEATNLSVARGTTLSFQAVGAPWLDSAALTDRFNGRALAGAAVEPVRFTPFVGPHAGLDCEGVRVHTPDARLLRPVLAALALLADAIALHRDQFEWALYPTIANPTGNGHFERLAGVSGLRKLLEQDANTADTEELRTWTATPGWPERWQSARLYE